jgi:hypothetical protein
MATPEELAALKAEEDKKLADEAKATAEAEAKAKTAGDELSAEEKIAKQVAEQVAEQLKDIKGKLDGSFAARDAAIKKAEALEKKERDAQLKILEEAGKHKEVFDLKLVEEQAKYADLESKYNSLLETNLDLTRNSSLREQLRGVEFKNEKASDMAFNSIISEIIKDDKGGWVHRTGMSIKDFVASFVKDEANSFLLKAKASTGSGTPPTGSASGSKSDSLVGKSNAEILAMAAAGKLPKRK